MKLKWTENGWRFVKNWKREPIGERVKCVTGFELYKEIVWKADEECEHQRLSDYDYDNNEYDDDDEQYADVDDDDDDEDEGD